MAIELYDLVGRNGRRYSPYGWRVRLALAHKGLSSQDIPCWHSDTATLAFSGQALVPVLVDGDTVVPDSWKIALYLDVAYPDRPMLMDGVQGRSAARFFNLWVDGPIGRLLVRSLYLDILQNLHPRVDAVAFRRKREERTGMTLEALQACRESDFSEVSRLLAPMQMLLAEQNFISGDAPAYSDYILFGTLQMPYVLGAIEVVQENSAVGAWQNRMRALYDGLAMRGVAFDPSAADGQ